MSYSARFTLPNHTPDLLGHIFEQVSVPAVLAHVEIRDDECVAKLTDLQVLSGLLNGDASRRDDQTVAECPRGRHHVLSGQAELLVQRLGCP
jgi:hypothetical protein